MKTSFIWTAACAAAMAIVPAITSGARADDAAAAAELPCWTACTAQPARVWVVGTEATFLSPRLNRSDALVELGDVNLDAFDAYPADLANIDELIISPRVWLGVQGERWGVVARYWGLDNSAANFEPARDFPVGPDSRMFAANQRLEAYTVDLEAVRTFTFADTPMKTTFGARYAGFNHDQMVTAMDVVNAEVVAATALASRRFYGTGLTSSLQGKHCLLARSNLSLFWNARSSILWGDVDTMAITSATAIGFGGSAAAAAYAESTTTDELYIGEFQVGLQWDRRLKSIPADAFFRAAFEYQYWDASVGSSDALAAAVSGDSAGIGTAEAFGPRMHLTGFVLGTGFNW